MEFDISSNDIRAEGVKALAEAIKGNQVMTELNIASNNLSFDTAGSEDMSGVATLVDAITDMGALLVANVVGNSIGKEQLSKLQEITFRVVRERAQHRDCSKPNLMSLCGIADDATVADLSGLRMDADDAAILASELPNKRVMKSLDISSNNLISYKLPLGWWRGQDGMFRSPLGSCQEGPPPYGTELMLEGIIPIADAISKTGAISKFTFSGDSSNSTVTMETSMTEADFSGKGLGVSGAIMLWAFLPKCT
jgi:hypothetical protein